MPGSDQTVRPSPLEVDASVTSLRTVEYLRETRPGWSVIKKVIRLGSAAVGFVLPADPEIAGTVDMVGEVGALYADVEGTRFVILICP